MINLSSQEIMMIIGNKELIIFGKDKEIEILRAKIEELGNTIKKLKEKEKSNG